MWTERGSVRQLEQRFRQYPLFREFSGLWGDHAGETILDYGCGPGNDLVGFALYSNAERIIGLDVSEKALQLASERLALHGFGPERVELIHAHDAEGGIPLGSESVDFAQSQGVIHHMSNPDAALEEIHRVLKPGGEARIMVYNRDSVWRHLYVAHDLALYDANFAGLEIDEAFKRSTDGLDCPISRNYSGPDFVAMCERAGFEAEFLGGYLSSVEVTALDLSKDKAIAEPRLADEHRDFLRALTFDSEGHPMHRGKHAGIGGSYRLRRP
jgi:ubiquinone/menaquinone biosynthesis C-methylase UbiE